MLPPRAPGSLRVASLNLWGRFADWPHRRTILGRLLPPLAIDVYLLQEVVCVHGGDDQLPEFAELLGYEWSARVVAESRPHEVEDEGVAIVSRIPLRHTAVWPLPDSEPPRNRLQASLELGGVGIRVVTLHAAVSAEEGRDDQIEALASIGGDAIVLGADLNAPPSTVRPLLGDAFDDSLRWDEAPTWPLDADEVAAAWEEKLGQPPKREPTPCRLDYLLFRGLEVVASGTVELRDGTRSASDHALV
jgi:endonuclease/exonuclease/phosphatase family metal-dependent hydrolase